MIAYGYFQGGKREVEFISTDILDTCTTMYWTLPRGQIVKDHFTKKDYCWLQFMNSFCEPQDSKVMLQFSIFWSIWTRDNQRVCFHFYLDCRIPCRILMGRVSFCLKLKSKSGSLLEQHYDPSCLTSQRSLGIFKKEHHQLLHALWCVHYKGTVAFCSPHCHFFNHKPFENQRSWLGR